MHKYYIEILHKNKFLPKLLNKLEQMMNKKTIWLILSVCEEKRVLIS